MKILIICQHYYPENFTITKIAEELVRRGNQVDVLTGKPNYGYGYILPEYKKIKKETINNVNVNRVNLYPRKKNKLSIIFNYLSFWNNSKKWVRKCKEKYDVVYTMSLSPVIMCCAGNLYKKLHNVKHVIHCVDLWPESVLVTKAIKENSILYKILYKWSKSIYEKADKILIGSPSFAEYFYNVLKITDDKFAYVPQPSLVENDSDDTYKYKDGINILYCGNLGLIQLIPLITESMKLVDNKKIYFHVIGMGPMTNYLQNEIIKNRLENNVFYHGPIPAKKAAQYFKGADALYVSLKDEGYVGKTIPNKLMMYMAFSKPIIGVLSGDGENILKESGGAIIVKQDPQSLKDAIIQFSNLSNEEKNAMGMANYKYYKENFTVEKIVEKIDYLIK